MVYRIYVEKKPGFDVEANGLKNELTSLLGIKDLTGLRLLNRYDVEGIDEALFNQCVSTVFSEPPVDNTYAELPAAEGVSFAVEYLPGQFDQRAASAAECIQLISQGERPLVRSARVYLLEGALTPEQVAEIKKYVINPVEAREASLETKETLKMDYPVPAAVAVSGSLTGCSNPNRPVGTVGRTFRYHSRNCFIFIISKACPCKTPSLHHPSFRPISDVLPKKSVMWSQPVPIGFTLT